MAKVRVSILAKEFGMTSKELMGHLAEMKIPAKSASSALEDAYVAMVRKQLASVIEARAQEVEAAKQAEEQAAAAEEADYIPFTEEADGTHSFTVPVKALDEGIDCAAFSKKKEKWYDRTLVFRADSCRQTHWQTA